VPIIEGEGGEPRAGEMRGKGIEALVTHTPEARAHDDAGDVALDGLWPEQPADAVAIARGKANLLPSHGAILRPDRPHTIAAVADLAEIETMIATALPGASVEVVDETGAGDHLRVTVTAPQFEGLSRLDQHRLVKAAVKERFDDGQIHALSIRTEAAR
jgi:stress-induced morphogen